MNRGQGGQRNPRGFLTDEEKKTMPKLSGSLMRRIFGYMKPYRLQFLLVFVAILFSSALGLLPSLVVGQIVDKALIGRNMTLLIQLVVLAFGTLLASQLVGVLESYLNAWISQHIIYDMKNEMYGHLQSMPHAFFTSQPQGDIITRMNSDIGGVSSVISNTLTGIIQNIVVVLTTAVALVGMSWQLSLVGILVIPLFILPTREVGKSRWKLLSEGQEKHDKMNSIVTETLSVSGSLLVKLFTREKQEMEAFREVNADVMKIAMKEQRSGKFFRVMMGMFAEIGPLLIYLAGGWLLITKTDSGLTVGAITATVTLIGRLYRPIQQLLNIQVDLTRSLALFSRIFDFLDRPVTIKSKPDAQKPALDNAAIAFEDVVFGYEDGQTILNHLNFTVPGGKMYAIVGPSGSGKSTIVNLIPRLYDVNSGAVKLADVNVKDIDLNYLRKSIGMVTQDTYLFNGSVRDNLKLAKADATQEELESACKIANIHELIMAQPMGYDTMVGNRGLKMSGGEKQRISIARTVLKNPDILILDEATSALDSILEAAIQSALETLMKKRTSIVIAHRLSTILSADQILVVKSGQVVEQGTHEQLLANGGLYQELYETQFHREPVEDGR
jgi:ABC-type multidrug transport system, ATPase and permease components